MNGDPLTQQVQPQKKKILLTRAYEDSGAFLEMFVNEPVEVLCIPFIDIQPAAFDTTCLQEFLTLNDSEQLLFFSSVNGVHHFFKQLPAQLLPQFKTIPALVVGYKTAQALKSFVANIAISPHQTATQAIEWGVQQQGLIQKNSQLLWPTGQLSSMGWHKALDGIGATCRRLHVYHTEILQQLSQQDLEALTSVDVVAVTSSSSAEGLRCCGVDTAFASLCSIGPSTTEAIREILPYKTLNQASSSSLEALGQCCLGQIQNAFKESDCIQTFCVGHFGLGT